MSKGTCQFVFFMFSVQYAWHFCGVELEEVLQFTVTVGKMCATDTILSLLR